MRGFTYLGLLFAIVLLGIVLSIVGATWHTESQRDKEKELLFAGQQYAKAINAYYAVKINGVNRYPASLNDLLEDRRFPMPVRYLRRRYVDPMTNSSEWGVINTGQGITGVYSRSTEKPIKQAGFPACCVAFADASSYEAWKFTALAGGTDAGRIAGSMATSSASAGSTNDNPNGTPDPANPTPEVPKNPQLAACNLVFYVDVRKCNLKGAEKPACQAAAEAKRNLCVASQ